MIDDESESPAAMETNAAAVEKNGAEGEAGSKEKEPLSEKAQDVSPPNQSSELPLEVKKKLRKLELMEVRYQGI